MRYTVNQAVNDTKEEPTKSVSFTCSAYHLGQKCLHIDAIVNDTNNKQRITTMISRYCNGVAQVPSGNAWNIHRVTRMDSGDVVILHVLMRLALSSEFRTSSVVLFDSRKQVLQKKPKQRAQCSICLGLAANRT